MTKTETLTVDVPVEIRTRMRGAVQAGDYASDNEIVAEALLDWEAKHGRSFAEDVSWLRQAVREADDDDRPDVPMEEVMDRLLAKYTQIASGTSRS
jgi:Arc/MetJ-type ribon-helix-helix transcriptional regulator